MIRRGIGSVQLLVGLAAGHGISRDACLRGSGIPGALLDDPVAEIDASQELTVVRNLVRLIGHVPGIGLEAGGRYHLTAYGIWGYAFLSSRTLRSASELGTRYLDLTFAFARFRIDPAGRHLRIVADDGEIPAEVRRFLVERDMAAAVVAIHDLFREPVPFREVAFRHERPPWGDRYADYFPGPVRFGASENALVVDAAWADRPLPQANERTARLCEEQCRELLDQRRARTPLSERVRQQLLRPGGDVSMEGLARSLGMAPRTLRRRLEAESTSFRRLLDEVREALAEEMLAFRMSVGEVAERLGYAEPSSFVHAFKRWKGVTPATWRKRDPRTGPGRSVRKT